MSETQRINPVRRELLKNALVTIADNMLVMVVRTARSTNIKNTMDFSAAILDADGTLVAQGLAVPVHLGAMMPALQGCLDYFGDDIHEGDIIGSNDPYSGCSHLNDIFTFKPVFKDGKRVAFLGIILHHSDLGGRVAGGNASDSNEIFEEGLRIPPSKFCERGRTSDTLMRMIAFNSRIPERITADLRAQMAACDQAEAELHKLLQSWSIPDFKSHMTDLVDYAEKLARAGIAALPDGEVEFTEWNDDDGVRAGPIKIHLKLTKRGDRIVCDFSGTPQQSGGAIHSIFVFTKSCAYAAVRTILEAGIPNNAGMYRPIEVIAPEGCFLHARFPAAVGSRGQVGYRVRTVVLGALSKLTQGRMPACPGGSEFAIAASGFDTAGQRFLHLEFHNTTGNGGGPDRDGQDAGPYCIGNLANVPVELIEAENPIRMEAYGFLPDTGGVGKYRGAMGIVRQYRFLATETAVQVRSDRFKTRPWGLFGGGEGAAARAFLNPGTPAEEALPSKFTRKFKAGDVFRAEMAGSGGYGDPLSREPEAVVEDVRLGKVSRERAREDYGVVVQAGVLEIDVDATRRARKERKASK